ncbi:MAG: hypothetical protein BRD21_02010 [Halobacteriales archaeon SW_8_66_22]|nr:MAG: hypothetical protein BRD21_02010 [Halobacteriales archaeon SW_8_66_22]
MDQRGRRRRTVLAAVGSIIALAGCPVARRVDSKTPTTTPTEGETSTPEDGDGTPTSDGEAPAQSVTEGTVEDLRTATPGMPPYENMVEPNEPGWTVIRANFEKVAGVAAYEPIQEFDPTEARGGGTVFPAVSDVAEELPTAAGISSTVILGLLTGAYPFLPTIDVPWQGRDAANRESVMQLEQVTLTNVAIQLEGQVDREGLAALDSVNQQGETGGFTMFTTQSNSGSDQYFAADDQRLLIAASGVDSDSSGPEPIEDAITALQSSGGFPEDVAWLLEHCGDGAFVYGGAADETDGSEGLLTEFSDADEETISALQELIGPATAWLHAAEGHEDGRVTRSGLVFESADAVPDADELASVLVPSAPEPTVVVDGKRVMVEGIR